MRGSAGVDELCCDPYAPGLVLDRAFQHIAYAEFLADLPHIDGLALVDPGRVARDHVQIAETGKVGDDVLGDPVREPAGCLVAAQIVERQHGDARSATHGRRLAGPEPPYAEGKDGCECSPRGRQEPAAGQSVRLCQRPGGATPSSATRNVSTASLMFFT